MSQRKVKNIDIGSMTSFKNAATRDYSLSQQKSELREVPQEQIVKIEIDKLEAAPSDWNFYPPLEGDEFERLVRSILVHGLLHPIVVEHIEGRNRILSGHNRVRAYRYIREELQKLEREEGSSLGELELSDVKSEDFREIFAIVKENLSDSDAREIIIDANYAQRQLGPKLLTKSIIEKYKIIREKRRGGFEGYKNRKTREIVAESFEMSGRHIDRYRKLESLRPELLELFYNGKISLETGAKLAVMKPEIQEEIEKNYLDLLLKYPTQSMSYFKPGMTKRDLVKMKAEITQEKQSCKVSFFHEGVMQHVVFHEEEEIKELIDLVLKLQKREK